MKLKPQAIVNRRLNGLLAFFVFAISLVIYAMTQARSLSFWDAGEYITCSSILGVPHPPGNPFYIVLGRFFVILLGHTIPHAIVVNFLSGLFSAFAVMFTYLFSVKLATMWLEKKNAWQAYLIGIIAAFYTAFSFTFWTNAIEAEVYSGLAFVLNLIVWLTLIWVEKSEDFSHQHLLLLIFYVFFLGFGIHQTSLQLAPAVVFIALYPILSKYYQETKSSFWLRFFVYGAILVAIYLIGYSIAKVNALPDTPKILLALSILGLLIYHLRGKVSAKAWIFVIILITVGVSTHLYLMIRSEFRPFINEGHPSTLSSFKDYVLRTQYGPTNMFDRRATFFYQMKEQFLTYFSWQFFHAETIVKWIKIPQNMIHTILQLFVALIGFKGLFYQYKKNKHSFAYFFSFFFWASIAMVFVMNLSDQEVRERDYFYVTAYNYWTFWMAVGSVSLIASATNRNRVLGFITAIVMVFMPILNLSSQYFIHDRSRELVALDYGQNLLNSLEENAIIFTNGDNDTFPLWYAQAVHDPSASPFIHASSEVNPSKNTKKLLEKAKNYKNHLCGIRKDASVVTYSLLNSPWYIQQIKDMEGIEFNIDDNTIQTCQTDRNSSLYPSYNRKKYREKIFGAKLQDTLTLEIPAKTLLKTADLAIIQIIRDNYGKRPIYFSSTKEHAIGLQKYLQMEGLVYRLKPHSNQFNLNVERTIQNCEQVYEYRGLFDENQYHTVQDNRIKHNYGKSYLILSQYFASKMDFGKAIDYFEKSLTFTIEPEKFYPSLSDLYIQAAYFLLQHEMIEEAYIHLENALYYTPENEDLLCLIQRTGLYTKTYDKAISLLQKVESKNQKVVKNLIDELQNIKNESISEN